MCIVDSRDITVVFILICGHENVQVREETTGRCIIKCSTVEYAKMQARMWGWTIVSINT